MYKFKKQTVYEGEVEYSEKYEGEVQYSKLDGG